MALQLPRETELYLVLVTNVVPGISDKNLFIVFRLSNEFELSIQDLLIVIEKAKKSECLSSVKHD